MNKNKMIFNQNEHAEMGRDRVVSYPISKSDHNYHIFVLFNSHIRTKVIILYILKELQKLRDFFHHIPGTGIKRHSMMNGLRLNVQNPPLSVRCQAARLLSDEGNGIAFIQQTQLACRMTLGLRIDKNPTFQQIPVKIGDQRTDVTGGIRSAG